MPKPDLNKLKEEIDNRKREKGIVANKLGESTNVVTPRKDEFLNGLLTSLQSGKPTAATNLIKMVENKAAERNGEKPKYVISEESQSVQNQNNAIQFDYSTTMNDKDASRDREELLWAEIEKRKKQTLTEQMQTYLPNNLNTAMGQPLSQPMSLNEAYLTENVKKVVNNYLSENFGPIVEEAIKSTILEMYAVERIKEVLQENKEMIQKIVYDTIRQIQAKSKAKAQ